MPTNRVAALLASMSLPEKLAQLQGLWPNSWRAGVVAPEGPGGTRDDQEFDRFAVDGLGQLTRVFGTEPVTPADGLAAVLGYQRWLATHTRHRVGAIVHEECLTGLVTWTATSFPAPIAWASTFDPDLVGQMGRAIGATMARLGVHQGLAPVLDVVRDVRWGRVEETIGEDPYVVATLGKAYVEGVQSQGVVATVKHFAAYSGSTGGRNMAPVRIGRRELDDVFLLPFEVAVRDAHVGSVMPAYVELDGVPMHANDDLLTGRLRQAWGFEGTVVSDYFGVIDLQRRQGVVVSPADAAALALTAGVDVELPTGQALRDPGFVAAVEAIPELQRAVDRALVAVLTQKEALGLLDIDAEIARLEQLAAAVPLALDPPEHRAIAASLAEESVILLTNHGSLPLGDRPGLKLAVIGPNADRAEALFGCYSFINHVLAHHPGVEPGIDVPTIADALRVEYPQALVSLSHGCDVRGNDRTGFPQAVAAAAAADVVVVVVGDQAGLFGAGTSGEGCDVDTLDLPGVQTELVEALLATGTPLVLVAITGRPYAIGPLAERAAATLQVFFPGEAGADAVAGVLSGRINPSGRLPVCVPASVGALPYSYLHPLLGDAHECSAVDPTPQFGFGFGLSYSSFDYDDVAVSPTASTDGWVSLAATVSGGVRDGAEVVQVYGQDAVASVTRPVRWLLAYARVEVPAGGSRRVCFRIPAARFALTDRAFRRVVEPGEVRVWLGRDCDHPVTPRYSVELTGGVCLVTGDTPRLGEVTVSVADGDRAPTRC